MRRASWGLLLGLAFAGISVARADHIEVDGLKAKTPAEWKEKDVSDMQKRMGRIRHFVLPKVGDDKHDAEVFVFYFQGQGGSEEENIKRYKGMFNPPAGKSIEETAKVEKMKAG